MREAFFYTSILWGASALMLAGFYWLSTSDAFIKMVAFQ